MDRNTAKILARQTNKRNAQLAAIVETQLEIEHLTKVATVPGLTPAINHLRTKLVRQEAALAATVAYLKAIEPDPNQLQIGLPTDTPPSKKKGSVS